MTNREIASQIVWTKTILTGNLFTKLENEITAALDAKDKQRLEDRETKKLKQMDSEKFYTFREFYIPERMVGGITRYLEERVEPGQFLQAIICNDLKEAVGRADDENLRNIPAFVAYFYNEAPSVSWGSVAAYKNWVSNAFAEQIVENHTCEFLFKDMDVRTACGGYIGVGYIDDFIYCPHCGGRIIEETE